MRSRLIECIETAQATGAKFFAMAPLTGPGTYRSADAGSGSDTCLGRKPLTGMVVLAAADVDLPVGSQTDNPE
jgi:hypothetical protein